MKLEIKGDKLGTLRHTSIKLNGQELTDVRWFRLYAAHDDATIAVFSVNVREIEVDVEALLDMISHTHVDNDLIREAIRRRRLEETGD